MPADNEASNARISQAVLKQVVEENTRTMKRVNGNQNDLEERTRNLEIEHARLDTRVKTWGSINSLGAVVAGVLGALGIKQ